MPPAYLAVQLSRWCSVGKLLSLRKGLYAYAGQHQPLPSLSNEIVSPSYLSGVWALSYYGMIPEAVWEYTAACKSTPRHKRWETPLGRFSYRQIKVFSGFERVTIHDLPTLIAAPEKALLDSWFWGAGEWSDERHREMRYQNLDSLDLERLESFAVKFQSPRINRARERFHDILSRI